jgi:4'-phosphopantetheinyl transferase
VPEIRDISAYQRLGLLNLTTFQHAGTVASRRDLERAGTRYLLDCMFSGENCELHYDTYNKPYLKGRNERISISHSHDMLAIISDGKGETGVDIELLREKVIGIRHKFLNPAEYDFAGENIERLITIWAAKEAMYKAYGRKQLDFKTQLEVMEFGGPEIKGYLRAHDERKSFLMRAEKIGDYMLVYILYEIQHAHHETQR